ncbi:MAG: DUF2791 family P-loop domain-containing protein [Clostridia bacterium]|nr:DUF2791 family P-loop domain-containing protein [Clostridia bacterium]
MGLRGRVIADKYKIMEMIAEGGMSTVWQALDMVKKETVVVKVLKQGVTSNRIEDVIRFRNEAANVAKLDIDGVVKVYEIGEVENTSFIAMEYAKGKSLFDLIKVGIQFTVQDAVDIIYSICRTLRQVHHYGIIHRDLKPGNIVVDFDHPQGDIKCSVKLIDFGLAQVKEFNMSDPGDMVGTLYYMAPEQIGLIKRPVDERSDLYSIGVIFYQLLSGVLPFKGSDLSSTFYQYMSKVPDKLIKLNPQVPSVLENIIFKLIEKEPDRRYQSVKGLLSDLKRVREGQEDFTLGSDDKVTKLNFRSCFIGRKNELEELKKLFDDVQKGKGSICFISGEPGSGKTRLVEELKSYALEREGIFVDGKCFSGRNKTPYAPFKEALDIFIRGFERNYSLEGRREIRKKLKKGLDNLGEVVLRLNPFMKEVIGSCPPLVELEPAKENQRFLSIISQFFYTLGKAQNGVVVFLDDLQWIDGDSIELLKQITTEIEKNPVLMIGTYREDEIPENHPVREYAACAANRKYPFHELHLKPFGHGEVQKLVSSILSESEGSLQEISRYVLNRCKGNVFFAIEILKQLLEEKGLVRKEGKWAIYREKVDQIDVPPKIVDVLMKKMDLLNQEELDVLSYAALIGRKFRIDLLFSLVEMDKDRIVEVIDRAIRLQLLEEIVCDQKKIQFVHDRIQEAFCYKIQTEKKKELHLKIAAALEKLYGPIEDILFDLTYHYMEADNRKKLLEYAYPAAIAAKNRYANEEAIKYFFIVNKILEENQEKGSSQWMETIEYIGDIYLIMGKTDEAIALFQDYMPYTASNLKKANVCKQIAYAYLKKGDWKECESYAKLGLQSLGEKLPENKTEILLSIASGAMKRIFSPVTKKLLRKYDPLLSETIGLTVWLYYIVSISYSKSGSLKFAATSTKMMNIAENRLSKSRELGLCTMTYALFLAELPWSNLALAYYKKALEMRKKMKDEWGIGQCYYNMGFYYRSRGEYRKSVECFITSMDILKRIGNIGEIGASVSGLVGSYLNQAEYENAKAANDQYFEICSISKDHFGMCVSYIYYMIYYMEKGDLQRAEHYGMKAYVLAEKMSDTYCCCVSGIILGKLYIEKGETRKVIHTLGKAKEFMQENNFLKEYTMPLYPFIAEAYLEEYRMQDEQQNKGLNKELIKNIKNLSTEAVKKTALWPAYHPNSLRVRAKAYQLTGEIKKAQRKFLESIELSKRLERRYELGVSLYEYGKFLLEIDKKSEWKKVLESSYNIFKNIGASAYEKRTAQLLGITGEASTSIDRFSKEIRHTQKISSIFELTKDISSLLDIEELYQKVLSIAAQVTGAQRGLLFIKDDKTGEFNIKQRVNMEEGNKKSLECAKALIHEAAKNPKPILKTNGLESGKQYGNDRYSDEASTVLCMPIKYKDELQGICYLDNRSLGSVFNQEDIEVLSAVMAQAAISMENAKLYKLAITDGLTELLTFRHFKLLLEREVQNCKKAFSLIMFDIDHFKRLNDTYGHLAGDGILINMAKIAKVKFSSRDIIARYGGEEFLVILPGTDLSDAVIIAEEFRKAIEKYEFIYRENKIKVTISVGIAQYPEIACDADALIKAADEALYLSKANGRNIVSVAKDIESKENVI